MNNKTNLFNSETGDNKIKDNLSEEYFKSDNQSDINENIANNHNDRIKSSAKLISDNKLSKNFRTEEDKETQFFKLEKELKIFEIEEDADISVSDPIKKEGFNSYILYSVKSKSLKDTIYRRYNDFFLLRSKLIQRWPGIYIPNIPPKKVVGNLEEKIINYRMKLLNKFCFRMCQYDNLLKSEEFSTFLSGSADIEKALNSLNLQTYEEIYNKYKKVFDDYNENFEYDTAKVKINEMNLFSTKIIANIRSFREQVNVCMQKKSQEIENSILSILSDYEKYSLLEYADNDDSKLLFFNPKNTELCLKLIKFRESLQNPYTKLYDWLTEEELDVEAIIESIASLNYLSESKEKLIQKKNTLVTNINDLSTGKTTIKNFFSIKSKKNETTELEKQKTIIEEQIKYLDLILKIATFNMEKNIQAIKVEKLTGYYQSLKLCAEIHKFNGTNIHSLWSIISKDKNIQEIKTVFNPAESVILTNNSEI